VSYNNIMLSQMSTIGKKNNFEKIVLNGRATAYIWQLYRLFFFNLRILITLWYLQTLLVSKFMLICSVNTLCQIATVTSNEIVSNPNKEKTISRSIYR